MSKDSNATARWPTRSVVSWKLVTVALCAPLGALTVSKAVGAPLTLNTVQDPVAESSFTLDFGEFGGPRTAMISTTQFDLQIDPAEGTARFLSYYQNVDPLILPGQFSTGNMTITIVESLGGEFDRTTGVFTTSDVYAVHFDGDLSAYGIESPFIMPGSSSGLVSFDTVSAGSASLEWAGEGELDSPFRSDRISYTYTCSVAGVFTSLNDSTWIVSSDPPHNAIDARQPLFLGWLPVGTRHRDTRTSKYAAALPRLRPTKARRAGWNSITVTMNSTPRELPTADDFAVEQTWDGEQYEAGPAVSAVRQVDATTFQVKLASRIRPGAWAILTHLASETSLCLGYLPGDSNADATTNFHDVTYLMDCLAGRATCDLWQCDMDRSGACNSRDVDRLRDLLIGNRMFDSWGGESLAASPCD